MALGVFRSPGGATAGSPGWSDAAGEREPRVRARSRPGASVAPPRLQRRMPRRRPEVPPMWQWLLLAALVAVLVVPVAAADEEKDPFLWLEEVEGKKSLDWVKERNAESTAELTK